jgi:hypothetical protein
MRCAYSAHGGDAKCYRVLVGKPGRKSLLGRLAVEGMIILKWLKGHKNCIMWSVIISSSFKLCYLLFIKV